MPFFFRKDEKRNYNIASWLCKIECVLTWLMLICKLRLSNSCFWLKFLMQTLPTPYRLWHNAKIVIVMVVINFYFMRQKIDIFCQGLSGFTLLIFGEAKKKNEGTLITMYKFLWFTSWSNNKFQVELSLAFH